MILYHNGSLLLLKKIKGVGTGAYHIMFELNFKQDADLTMWRSAIEDLI